jgi:hypothetical protein
MLLTAATLDYGYKDLKKKGFSNRVILASNSGWIDLDYLFQKIPSFTLHC